MGSAAGGSPLRSDLLTLSPRPLPPLTWPPYLSRLPHVLILLLALALAGTGADLTAHVLSALHAVPLALALRWPAPAWALALVMTSVIVLAHPPTPSNTLWVWVVQASVLFLLSLRVRTSSVAAATGVTIAVMLTLKVFGAAVGNLSDTWLGLALLVAAPVLGTLRRGRREDRARLAEQFLATAQERAARTVLEERARIARELHDVVAHHMSLISVQADAARYRVPDPPAELLEQFTLIRANALEGLGELRRLLGVLRPEAPGEETAGTAPQPSLARLDDLLASVRAAGLSVSLERRGDVRSLSAGVELSSYRIIQEALSNALRHAPGSEAAVRVQYAPATVSLTVVNTPPTLRSTPAGPSLGAGHGLTGMRERAAMLGGELSAGPAPDGGWAVTAQFPAPTTAPTPVQAIAQAEPGARP